MKNKVLFLSFVSVFSLQYSAQDVLIVDGGSINVMGSASVTVIGGIVNQNSGTIDNSGTIRLSGDWTNNGGNTMLINNSPGTVELNGGVQTIKGSDVTNFYNLKLSGSGGSVKAMDIDANVSNTLDLGDEELQTHENIIHVNNPAVGAVVWNTGFVNSDKLGGYLARATNNTSKYTFPVGSSILTDTYRPVFLTPSTSAANVYAVRLADVSPDTDNSGTSAAGATGPFPVANKDAQIRSINTEFYYNIFRISGADPVDIQVDYFNADGSFQTLAQWSGANNRWEDRSFSYAVSSTGSILNSPDVSLTKSAVNDFNTDVFALAEIEFTIKVPGGVSPNADGYNDNFVIENLEYFPKNELVIFNRWGDVVYKAAPYTNNWNGQVNAKMVLAGEEVVDGTYFYILTLDPDGEQEPIKGYVELRRK